jgi:hypothetical protein
MILMEKEHQTHKTHLAISEFLANKWLGAQTNEIAGRGGVQEARFDCALPMPPFSWHFDTETVAFEMQDFSKAAHLV